MKRVITRSVMELGSILRTKISPDQVKFVQNEDPDQPVFEDILL